jgi:hypothetical protein
MADASRRTRRGDGHTKSEMNRNREQSFGGALTTRKHAPSDAPGVSSARSRSTRSGADRAESLTAKRGGGGGSGATGASRDALPDQSNRRGPSPRAKGRRAK